MENSNKKFIFGIIGFALALSALCLFVIPYFGIILAVAALVLSIIGLSASRLKGFGIAGTIISPIALLLSILFTFVFTSIFARVASGASAEKKAQNILSASKPVLLEASASGDYTYEGITVTTDGKNYFITVTDLKNLGEIDKNPFKSNNTDGGMTINYNTETGTYTCDVHGTIDGYNLEYLGAWYGFRAYKD